MMMMWTMIVRDSDDEEGIGIITLAAVVLIKKFS